jgi:hypothetical protein
MNQLKEIILKQQTPFFFFSVLSICEDIFSFPQKSALPISILQISPTMGLSIAHGLCTYADLCLLRPCGNQATSATCVSVIFPPPFVQHNHHCGIVIRVAAYRSRGPVFDFRRYHIFWKVVSLERGPLGLMRIIEELFQGNGSSGLENRDPLRWPRDTLYPQKLALTSPTSGGRSVGIVRFRTKTTEFFLPQIESSSGPVIQSL